jgi:WD40 repeat protein
LFSTNGVTAQAILKQQLYGSIHGLSVSPDGL